MRNPRTIVGALFIIVAMVLGAFAGLLVAGGVGDVGVSPNAGASTGAPRLVGTPDETGRMSEVRVDADGRPLETDLIKPLYQEGSDSPVSRVAGVDTTEIASRDGTLLAKRLTPEQEKEVRQQEAEARVFRSEGGILRITADPTPGTRAGAVDAGGPYGGPTCFEGSCTINFVVTPFDPNILFFRYDWNNDGLFDYPVQGADTLGTWTIESTISRLYLDNWFGDIMVEGWDGISTRIEINTGESWQESTSWVWTAGMFGANYRMVGWVFQAKKTFDVTELGRYHYIYQLYSMSLWRLDGSVRTRLGLCTPDSVQLQWNWCTLPSAVTLVAGQRYWIAERIETWTTGFNPPLQNQYAANFESTYGCFIFGNDPNMCGPFDAFFNWGSFFIITTDFKYRETLILADAASDSAFVQVQNVAPTAFGATSSPNPGLEGSETQVTAFFNDPGLDDTWEFRWTFHDGTISPWQPVTKLSGGARVLYLHAQSDFIGPVSTGLREACGDFCVALDLFDFGPLGENRVPALAELLPYDVVYVAGRWGPIPSSDGMGNVLADYMDAGGNVIIDHVANFANNIWGIGGRWQSDGYAPVPRGSEMFANTRLGTIRVPGHPILDGIGSWTALFILNINGMNAGATRIADWLNGRIAIATNTNPNIDNGARSVYIDMVPFASFSGGDKFRVMANSIRWASQQLDPVPKAMPLDLDLYPHVYKDDDPTTTTLEDTFPVSVEVRDDDHDKVQVSSMTELSMHDFQKPSECSGPFYWMPSTWPPGWSADPNGYGWQCHQHGTLGSRGGGIWYYYNDNDHSFLYTGTYDFSSYIGVRFEFDTVWRGDYPFGTSDGIVEASTDGGATWPIEVFAFHHNDPATFRGTVSVDKVFAASSDTVFRFRYESSDDWYWFVDNVRITGLEGVVVQGLGSTEGFVTVANVAPTVIGGFDSALRMEAQSLRFSGFRVSDPALLESTEWFAYSWNLGDGTPTQWTYKGTMEAPKFRVLIVHSLGLSGNGGSLYDSYKNQLLALDDVASVDGYNIIQFPPSAPGLSRLLQYDVIIFASFWAYLGYDPWDTARRITGDQIASYLDARRGGVLTTMFGLDIASGFEAWSLDGRYITDQYAPFKKVAYVGSQATLGTVDPEHDALIGVNPGGVSAAFHGGNYPVTVGGKNAAAGVNGEVLARWDDGTPAFGVKELNNGRRTAHIGSRINNMGGADLPTLLRNGLGWTAGGIPTPKLTPFTYTYGDNGVYTVELNVIDDDMGFVWDAATNQPLAVLPGSYTSRRALTVSVDNVDPTIRPGVQAFIAAEVCLRVSGTGGNTVSARGIVDGVDLGVQVSVTRESGSPNPTTEKCSLMQVDVLASHTYQVNLVYTAPNGGSNPTWLLFLPWRTPITPSSGTITLKYDEFNGVDTTVSTPLPTLKQDLLAGGEGAPIDFVAEACDTGSDDVAFFWQWGTVDGVPYDPTALSSVYTIHVFHNDGTARTNGVLATPDLIGFREPYFDQDANTGTSPSGPTNRCYRDVSVHAFDMSQPIYYVTLLVMDDDVGREYASHFQTPGTDMTFLVLDLR